MFQVKHNFYNGCISVSIDNSMIDFDRLNFDQGNMNKNLTRAKKSILKLVKLQILVAKSSKMVDLVAKSPKYALPTFPVPNTNIIKNSQTSQGYIFSLVYNISPQNFAILLILGCYFYF